MKKSIVTLLVVSLLLALVIPAGAEGDQWALPYQGDSVTLKVMGWETYSDYNWDNAFGKWVQEKLGNVKIEMEIPVSDTATLLDLYLSSGSGVPDIMMYRDPDKFMLNYSEGGRTLNLLDYADYMPEYMARRDQFPHLSRYDTDGASYMFFPSLYDKLSEVWFQNDDLMAKYNLTTPTTWDEMKACMETVINGGEEDAVGILCLPWGFGYYYNQVASMFGSLGHGPTGVSYDYDQGKWVYDLIEYEDLFKTVTTEMAEAYAKGWLHTDFATWESGVSDDYRNNGKWLFTNQYVDECTNMTNQGLNFSYITTPTAMDALPHVRTDYVSDATGWIYLISNTTAYPELCAQFLELLGSEEYATALGWGFIDDTYTVDENGNRAFTEAFMGMEKELRKSTYGLSLDIPYATSPYISSFYTGDALIASAPEVAKTALSDTAEKLATGEYVTYYGALTPVLDDYTKEDIAVVTTAYGTYINENLMKFVMGTRSLSEWDDFMGDLSTYGDMEWVLEQYNAAEQMPLRAQQSDRNYLSP